MKIYKIPKELKTVIFDIDSTLYTNPAYEKNQQDVIIIKYGQEAGISQEEAQKRIAHYRKKFAEQNHGQKISLGNTLAALGIPISRTIEWRKNLIRPENFLSEDKKLQTVVKELNERFSLICVTNNPVVCARKTLDILGISSFIPEVIGIDICGVSKPAKEPFLLAAEKTNANPQNCLAVGDRYDIDVALPLELGMGGITVESVNDVYRLSDILSADTYR
ncbi:HAD family hydrolase [Treponema parvum]|uniref:HAD family hydrolase n=1 Tax=Treponema parvum TaxID=138851 RepID=A0A975F5Q6_9SPIR|nr:HAD family hydrolase [Treponema parvum]QTQ14961.1 HAD family hydrolase [Treponema parvum]